MKKTALLLLLLSTFSIVGFSQISFSGSIGTGNQLKSNSGNESTFNTVSSFKSLTTGVHLNYNYKNLIFGTSVRNTGASHSMYPSSVDDATGKAFFVQNRSTLDRLKEEEYYYHSKSSMVELSLGIGYDVVIRDFIIRPFVEYSRVLEKSVTYEAFKKGTTPRYDISNSDNPYDDANFSLNLLYNVYRTTYVGVQGRTDKDLKDHSLSFFLEVRL